MARKRQLRVLFCSPGGSEDWGRGAKWVESGGNCSNNTPTPRNRRMDGGRGQKRCYGPQTRRAAGAATHMEPQRGAPDGNARTTRTHEPSVCKRGVRSTGHGSREMAAVRGRRRLRTCQIPGTGIIPLIRPDRQLRSPAKVQLSLKYGPKATLPMRSTFTVYHAVARGPGRGLTLVFRSRSLRSEKISNAGLSICLRGFGLTKFSDDCAKLSEKNPKNSAPSCQHNGCVSHNPPPKERSRTTEAPQPQRARPRNVTPPILGRRAPAKI